MAPPENALRLERSGQVLVAAAVAREYRLRDIDGRIPTPLTIADVQAWAPETPPNKEDDMRQFALGLLGFLLLGPTGAVQSEWEQRGCVGDVHTSAARIPGFWHEVNDALSRTGVSRRVAALCYRGTEVWSAWVLVEHRADQPEIWAVVSFDGRQGRTLCLTTEERGCGKYWNPRLR